MTTPDDFLQHMQNALPAFIEEEYPKGKTKERGAATVACALFILWLKKNPPV